MGQLTLPRASVHNMNNKGFTLFESMLYIAISALVLLAVFSIGLEVTLGKAKLKAMEEVSQNARVALETMSDTIRNAEAINSPTAGSSASSLSLQMVTGSENPSVFDLSSGIVRITEGVGSAVNLTTDEVNITALTFQNLSYTDTPGTVRISMTIEYTNPGGYHNFEFEKTYYTTVNIYEK